MCIPSRIDDTLFDLAIVGGGINGAGIAREAAHRGLSVLLCDKDDFAQHTSSASSKLIHGGLRYLEYYEFRLVSEALAEREVLLSIAPHIIWPMEFCLPHVPDLRPAWMIRSGLFLYDHLGKRKKLPGSRGVSLAGNAYGRPLKPEMTKAFVYSDCWVDDARLVIGNIRSAARHGAVALPRTACAGGRRVQAGGGTVWELDLRRGDGTTFAARAKAVVNATGPWVKQLLIDQLHRDIPQNVKQVKGSHIVVPRLFDGAHAYITQNDDKRIVFLIPYESDFTLIGTTDVELSGPPSAVQISEDEIAYLCRAANRYLARSIAPSDVVWTYSGVRPLYDDGESDPSAITRDYTLVLDAPDQAAPLLSIFGGKITTYRKLAETAVAKLEPFFTGLGTSRTGEEPLPGGEIPGADFEAFVADLAKRHAGLDAGFLRTLARRHGADCQAILRDARTPADLGEHFGDTLYAAEVDHLVAEEWATTGDDVLWRRTKCGLHLAPAQRERVAAYVAARVAAR
jgi:glycerol-3-phosphate dehydrogenase